MNRTTTAGVLAAMALFAAGCNGGAGGGGAAGEIGTVNVSRITANWPKYLNYQNQLSSDAAASDRASVPEAEKARQRAALQQRELLLQAPWRREMERSARGRLRRIVSRPSSTTPR